MSWARGWQACPSRSPTERRASRLHREDVWRRLHGMKILATSTISFCLAAGTLASPYEEDAARAANLRKLVGGKVLNENIYVQWMKDESHLWFHKKLAEGGHQIVLVNTTNGERRPAFDHDKLAASLKLDAGNLDVRALEFGPDPNTLILNIGKKGHLLNLEDYTVADHPPLDAPAQPRNDRRRSRGRGQHFPGADKKSPDGKYELVVHDHAGRRG